MIEETAETTGTTHRFVAGPADDGSRVDAFLADALTRGLEDVPSPTGERFTRARVQRLVDEGRVSIDGVPVKSSSRVKAGAVVVVDVPAPRPMTLVPEAIPLRVLFEDDDLIVIDKPAGLAAHAGAGRESGTLVNALLAHCTRLSGIGDVMRPGIVHRLDKDTTGLLVAAKSDLAHQSLSAQFHAHSVDRRYRALVHGRPPARMTVDASIGRDPRDRKRFAAGVAGRHAVTHVERVEQMDAAALVDCRLETGRTHQIRVHLASRGFPVVGDPLYGPKRVPANLKDRARTAVLGAKRQMLHAYRLGFDHPRTGERVTFTAPVPDDMAAVVDAFREAP